MKKSLSIALISYVGLCCSFAAADTGVNELFKHSINSTYTEFHDPNLAKWRAHELGILNEYTKYAQQQIDYLYEDRKGPVKEKYSLVQDNKHWWDFVDKSCDGIVKLNTGDGMSVFDKNLCEINMMRQRTYFIWMYFLHSGNTDILSRPNSNIFG